MLFWNKNIVIILHIWFSLLPINKLDLLNFFYLFIFFLNFPFLVGLYVDFIIIKLLDIHMWNSAIITEY